MIDEFAIQQTINVYSGACSLPDWDQVLSTFTPDGFWEVPHFGLRFEGHKAVLEGLLIFSTPMDYIVQINAPALIKVDGDVATARSVIRECGKYAGRDEALEVLGFYSDQMVRTPDGWKFAGRTFEVRGLHSFPLNPPIQP